MAIRGNIRRISIKGIIKPRNPVKLASTATWILVILFLISACEEHPHSAQAPTNPQVIDPADAEAGAIQSSGIGKSVSLDASASSGTGLRFHWLFRSKPTDSQSTLSNFEAKRPSFTPDQPGTYVLQLIVMDAGGGTSKDFVLVDAAGNQGLVDHTGVDVACHDCHNGIVARGRSANHIDATVLCVACHTVSSWAPVAVDHNEVLGVCTDCHDGILVIGKPMVHIDTNAECNLCHVAGTSFSLAVLPADPVPAAQVAGFVTIMSDEEGDEEEEEGEYDEGNGNHPPIGNAMCVDCHNNVIQEGKEADHILSTDLCEACHNTWDWEPVVTVDHTQVIGSCSSCHNKPSGHIPTTAECNTCHGTEQWLPTLSGGGGGSIGGTVDHSGFTQATNCMACHDGTSATGKPLGHVVTSSDCDSCHTTNSWIISGTTTATVDHSNFTQATVCMNCHNGSTATGKPTGHIATNSDCDVCHNTTSWLLNGGTTTSTPVDHSNFTSATVCMNCHDGSTATGKPAGHVVTSSDCDVCHTTTTWLQAGSTTTTVDHSNFTLATVCTDCHDDNTATGKPTGHVTTSSDCDTCHTTSTWLQSGSATTTVDHGNFTAATICMACHDGNTATGKPVGHITTSSDCDICHSTTAWLSNGGISVDHSNFTWVTVCMNCHDGTTATGKPVGHIITTNDCDICHTTVSFSAGLAVNHGIFTTATVCMDCHNGVIAQGKPRGHIITIRDCDACHSTWNFD